MAFSINTSPFVGREVCENKYLGTRFAVYNHILHVLSNFLQYLLTVEVTWYILTYYVHFLGILLVYLLRRFKTCVVCVKFVSRLELAATLPFT